MFSLNVPPKYSNTIYNTMRPLYIFCRIFGYAPFSATITNQSANKIYLTKFDHFIFITHVTVFALCTFSNLTYHYNMSSSRLLMVGTQIQLVGGSVCCILVLFVELFLRNSCWKIVENLNDFDIDLETLGKTMNHSKHKKFLIFFLLVWSLMAILLSIYTFVVAINYSELVPLLLFLTSYLITNGVFGTIMTVYAFFLLSLKVRFQALNDCLRDESQLLNRIKVIESKTEKDSVTKIIKIAQLHDQLSDTIGLINRRYSIQVMSLIAGDFVFSVFSLYGFYRAFYFTIKPASPVGDTDISHSISHTLWSTYYHFFTLTLIWSGSSVRSEGEFTGVLIHRIINNCSNLHAIEKLSLFSQQLQHQVPIATCQLFTFDWTLLFTIIGATTTYLTILIQFDSI